MSEKIVSTYLLEDKLRAAEAMGAIDGELVKDLLISVAKLRSQISILSEKYGESEAVNAKLRECVDLADECLGSQIEEPCRYDHNRNCQNHGWFGLDGEDCPVAQYIKARETLKELEGVKGE